MIRKRILQLAVAFSTSALDKKVAFMLKVLENLLTAQYAENPDYPAYSEAVKELHSDRLYELQRLANKMPDQLIDVYDTLEAKVKEIISTGTLDSKRQTAYETFLFTILHRTTKIPPEIRIQKLSAFITPVQQLWQNPQMDQAIETFPGFCDLLGLNEVRDYLVSRRVHTISDWGKCPLDEEGQRLQKQLEERLKALPLRTTKSFLGCSLEKIEKDTPAYKVACNLWRDALPVILPSLLKFLSHAHAFHNPANWAGLPSDMQPLVSRILTDRFWQAGISEGSKDDFYARVTGTKSTMEGFASSIRSSVRTVREACYSILWCMSRMDVDFYGFSELPGPLAHALFSDAHCLSSHQLIALLNVVRLLVDDCPVEVRSHFVPPILATCFAQMDAKCSSEWDKLAHKQVSSSNEENLTDEMKEESILRQLTYAAVMMIGGLLDPARQSKRPSKISQLPQKWSSHHITDTSTTSSSAKDASTYDPASTYPSMRKFCLSSSTILEPLLLFLTHAIRMRDSRCCGIVLRVFRSLVPDFASTTTEDLSPQIREFVSTEVLKACISSLNEPYFVELQRELALLIASILIHYSSLTPTPRSILLSLPGIDEKSVDKCIDYVCRNGMQSKQQRALVLDLLRDVRGVSISEQGKIKKSLGRRSKLQQEFLKPLPVPQEHDTRAGTEGLEGVAGMFGEEEL